MKLARVACITCLLVALATPAIAGPPLICHPFDIGSANSLPWTGSAWNLSGNEGYDTANLVRDTLAILNSDARVIVHMETLRRATLYAGKEQQRAKELLTRLHARAEAAPAGRAAALAWFDAGYLTATYGQWLAKERNPAAGLDGYGLVQRALALSGNDPEMEFAAALITLRGPQHDHLDHTQKALAGAKTDALLARNLSTHFLGNANQTVAEALGQSGEGGEQ
jgi:cell wall-associated NlpC family hydrolase